MNPSPSTYRRYINFNHVFQYKASTYRAGTRYTVPGVELFGIGTYVRYLINLCFRI
jgi:hypothetical protein